MSEPTRGVPGGWSRPDPTGFDPAEFGEEPDPPFDWTEDDAPTEDDAEEEEGEDDEES